MLIAVNTRLLIPGKLDGIGWFTYETLRRITTGHPEHRFLFLFDRPVPDEYVFSSNTEPLYLFPPSRHPILWHWWFEYSVRKVLESNKPDLFLSPDGFLCLSTNTISIPVIHDINFHHRHKDIPFPARYYYVRQFPKFARKARRIATVSEYSKQDISSTYGVGTDRIDVVYNGGNPLFKPLDEETKQKAKASYTNGAEYFLFVGSLHPRKNLTNLLLAFDEFRKTSEWKMKLLVVGEQLFKTGRISRIYKGMRYREDVVFAGWQPVEELRLIFGSALALTFVSCFEGFGLPILEAMQCDVPVITSNVTSMPEIGGDAVLLADPFSVESIKNAMLRVAGDPLFRADLVEKGRVRREKFSWDRTAEKLWESMLACLNRSE